MYDFTPVTNGVISCSRLCLYIHRRREWRKILQSIDCVSHILRRYLTNELQKLAQAVQAATKKDQRNKRKLSTIHGPNLEP